MEEFMKKSQVLKLFLIAALLFVTPLLPTSLRSTYLYFIVNILIVLVGADAGLLSFFLDSSDNKQPAIIAEDKDKTPAQTVNTNGPSSGSDNVLDKVNGGPVKDLKVKKSTSTPSIFFIGGGEAEDHQLVDDVAINGVDDDEREESGGQELFNKAETFIGNFYKQLKMQREESWKKLHDLYQKAF